MENSDSQSDLLADSNSQSDVPKLVRSYAFYLVSVESQPDNLTKEQNEVKDLIDTLINDQLISICEKPKHRKLIVPLKDVNK